MVATEGSEECEGESLEMSEEWREVLKVWECELWVSRQINETVMQDTENGWLIVLYAANEELKLSNKEISSLRSPSKCSFRL